MRKIIILLAVIGAVCWFYFFDFMAELYHRDVDDFWIVLSLTGITLLTFIFWMWIGAINSDNLEDDDNSKIEDNRARARVLTGEQNE